MKNEKTPIELVFSYRSQIMVFAAFWILCSHSIGIVGERMWPYLGHFKPLIAFGWGGVDIFLFLSGMGILLSLQKKPLAQKFFSKRFNRIYPVFFIAVTIEHLIYNHNVTTYFLDVTTLSYWTAAFGFTTKNTFWYVSAAFAFYILSYPYYKYFFSKKPLLSTVLVSLLGFSLYYVLPFDFFLARVPIYFIGMYAALFMYKNCKIAPFVILSIVTYLILGYSAYRYGGSFLSDNGLHFMAFIFITPGLTFLLAKCFSWLDNIRWGGIIVKYVGFVGRISLELYLTHWILLCAINSFDVEMSWGIFVLLSLLCAYALHVLANVLNNLDRIRLKY